MKKSSPEFKVELTDAMKNTASLAFNMILTMRQQEGRLEKLSEDEKPSFLNSVKKVLEDQYVLVEKSMQDIVMSVKKHHPDFHPEKSEPELVNILESAKEVNTFAYALKTGDTRDYSDIEFAKGYTALSKSVSELVRQSKEYRGVSNDLSLDNQPKM